MSPSSIVLQGLGLVQPVWVLVSVFGALAVSAAAVIWPPRLSRYPVNVGIGVIGAALGQSVADSIPIGDAFVGDAHVIGITVGALLGAAVVRRLLP